MTKPSPLRVTLSEVPEPGDLNPYLGLIFASETFRQNVELFKYKPFSRRIKGGVFHLHWPEKFIHLPKVHRFAPAVDLAYANMIRAIDRMKRDGGQLIWTAHNLNPHDIESHRLGPVWHRWQAEIYSRVDRFVAMSATVETRVREHIPELTKTNCKIIPHPHYRGYFDALDETCLTTRSDLGLPENAFVVSMLGLIRRYKNIGAFVKAFEAADCPNTYLLIAGECYDGPLQAELAAQVTKIPNVIYIPRALSQAEYARFVQLSDLFALNFSASLNSGSIYAALSLDTPVLAPNLGATSDVAAQVGDDWVKMFQPPLMPETLAELIANQTSEHKSDRPNLAPNEPAIIAQAHLDLYRKRTSAFDGQFLT